MPATTTRHRPKPPSLLDEVRLTFRVSLFPKVLLGMGATAALFVGFWDLLKKQQDIQVALGMNPHYEQVLYKLANAQYYDLPPIPCSRSPAHNDALNAPWKQHNHHHITLDKLKATGKYSPELRYQVPPPQRGKTGDIDHPYTKSPDYVDNYEKTRIARERNASHHAWQF